MKPTRFQSLAVLLFAAFFSACTIQDGYAPKREIAVPKKEAVDRVAKLQKNYAGLTVRYSQVTGEILWIGGDQGAVLKAGAVAGFGRGLNKTNVLSPSVAQHFIHMWMTQCFEGAQNCDRAHSELYRVRDVAKNIVVSKSKVQHSSGLVFHRFEQRKQNALNENYWGTAVFNVSGDFLGILTRFYPTLDYADDSDSALSAAVFFDESYFWDPQQNDFFKREVHFEGPTRVLTLTGYFSKKVIVKRQLSTEISVRNDLSWIGKTSLYVSAPNTQNKIFNILSTLQDTGLISGFQIPGIVAGNRFVSIASCENGPLMTNGTTFETDQKDWASDPGYSKTRLRDATGLAVNVEKTLRWFSEKLSWVSWDNAGGSLITGILCVPVSGGDPWLNASGGGGFIQIGNGLTDKGRPLSESLQVVAHEFMHSVTWHNLDLDYSYESGAINEALSDFFATCVSGWENTEVGGDIGFGIRNIEFPEKHQDPKTYHEYRVYPDDDDIGGVHSNSTILSFAFARAVNHASSDLGVSKATASEKIAAIVLDQLSSVTFGAFSRMEEFAVLSDVACAFSSLERRPYCDALHRGFLDAKLF